MNFRHDIIIPLYQHKILENIPIKKIKEPLSDRLSEIQEFFERTAQERLSSKKKNKYYYRKVSEYLKFIIPENSRVLEVGSGDGELLAGLKPSRGVGFDASPFFVKLAGDHHPRLEFHHGFAVSFKLEHQETFDYIVLSDLVGYLDDVQSVFQNLHQACSPSTRIVINYYNYLWEPLLNMGSKIGWRMKKG